MFLNARSKIEFIFSLLICLMIIEPLKADLGEANIKPFVTESKTKLFNAWCAEKDNKCLVSFNSNRLIVNNNSGIKPEQLISWVRNITFIPRKGIGHSYHLYIYDFEYRDKNDKTSFARIIFQNSKPSDKFYKELKDWAPSKETNCNYNFELRKVVC